MAGLGAAALGPHWPAIAAPATPLALRAAAETVGLRPNQAETAAWALRTSAAAGTARFGQGERLDLTVTNALPVALALDCHGLDAAPGLEPLLAQKPLAAGAKASLELALGQAGTFLCALRPLGGGAQPVRPLALVATEKEPVAVDRDEVFLVEEWRLRADGTPVAAGADAGDAETIFTANGALSQDISLRAHERLRLRLINGSERRVIAVKIEGLDVRVMALDSQPCEPFQARNGALVLAPGARVDVLIDATGKPASASPILLHDGQTARPIGRLVVADGPAARPAPLPAAPALPANGLPDRIDLKDALRVDMPLGRSPAWTSAEELQPTASPAFRARRGRAVVLALTNPAEKPTVFRLHGHHFRLLDRLDDGWKPFWLDTLAVEPGQTQRVAFLAEHAGRWLVEACVTDWAAPRLVRWYSVE